MASIAAAPVAKEQTKQKPSSLRSVLAGATAGAIEISITYPFEFAKTRSQLNRRLPDAEKLPWPRFPSKEWYAGCTTLIIGNSIKAGVRFVSFDAYKNLLADADGKVSGPRTVAAGFGAGITESLLAVTPFESIKTQLIDDRKRAQPRMRGFIHGSGVIAREKGIRGFFQGFVPTTARQAANSAVRFSTYTWIKQFAESYVAPGEKLGMISTFGIGSIAGIVTVYTTMPLDTVKTRMQSLEAKKNYKNSIACAVSIVKNEGVLTLWSGALPRLGRLSLSGGIAFAVYEKTMELFDTFDPDRKYI
jgi:solute carrier family 25 (mitochondrial citrate transporter), member 1